MSEQMMLEALKLADAALSGANMNMNVVMRKVKEALAQQPAADGVRTTPEYSTFSSKALIAVYDSAYNKGHRTKTACHIAGLRAVELAAKQPAAVPECEWLCEEPDEQPDTWRGACGAIWSFIDGGPKENSMNFCPSCGGRVHIDASQPEVKS